MYDGLRADFRAAEESRFVTRLSGVAPTGSGADYHYRNETKWLRMIERARHFQRNDCVVGQGVRRLVSNVVQDGFTLDVQTGDPNLDADLKARWVDYWNDADQCHSEGELTGPQIEQLLLSQITVDGDVFFLTLTDGSLQPIEAHRCRTPSGTTRNVVHGVLVDERSRRTEYWFTKQELDPLSPLSKVGDIKPYAARDADGYRQVLHCYFPNRFSQRRGVTTMAPSAEMIGLHDDLQFTHLIRAKISSLIAIVHNRTADWRAAGDDSKGNRTEETDGNYTRVLEELAAGLEIFGDPGEEIRFDAARTPSPEFFNHAMLILTFIAVNLDLPVAVLLLDPSNTNFSGWRGAIDQARMRFKQIQQGLVGKFHCPVYKWKVRNWGADDPAIARAALRSGINLYGHRWNPPAFRYIEPLVDAQADLLQQRNALQSPRRLQAARGQDWDDVSTEIVEDNAAAIEKAVARADMLNKKFPSAKVHWRELISLPTPDGVQIALPQPAAAQKAAPVGRAGDEPPPANATIERMNGKQPHA
jgi:capsid protein